MARICTNCGLESYSADSQCEHCGKPFEVKQKPINENINELRGSEFKTFGYEVW